jgi:predicted Zn-dependent protease
MVGLGECLVALGDGHRAAPVLRRAGGLCASSHRPALAFGRMFMQQGYLQEAEQALRMARSRECGEALCEINQTLSEVYERQGRMLPAYQAARAALQDRPDDPALVQRCVTLALSLGRPGDAEQLYRSLLELRPGNVQALRGLAELCTAAGRPDEADRLLETASLLTGAAQ